MSGLSQTPTHTRGASLPGSRAVGPGVRLQTDARPFFFLDGASRHGLVCVCYTSYEKGRRGGDWRAGWYRRPPYAEEMALCGSRDLS